MNEWAPRLMPAAPLENLRRRAEIASQVRRFLSSRGYLEVETPLLAGQVVVDLHLEPLQADYRPGDLTGPGRALFLQTSPELGMKRLLAAGIGSIFQITRAFRNGEMGPLHNPEFTIVEWYRLGASYHELIDEVEALVGQTLGIEVPWAQRLRYREAFVRQVGIDPFEASDAQLHQLALTRGYVAQSPARDDLLDFLLCELVQPALAAQRGVFLLDYPASQAALARIRPDEPPVAQRFELFVEGVELCNGYQELTDAEELARRMHHQNELRRAKGRRILPPPDLLETAMRAGLPECAGVALGLDRLVMVALGARTLSEVMAFTLDET